MNYLYLNDKEKIKAIKILISSLKDFSDIVVLEKELNAIIGEEV